MTEPDSLQLVGLNEVRLGRRNLTYFSGCDYFRLARDPRVAHAALTALNRHGLNVAASRRTTGNHPIYGLLEAALAEFFGAEAAVILPDGYCAPLAVAQAGTSAGAIAIIQGGRAVSMARQQQRIRQHGIPAAAVAGQQQDHRPIGRRVIPTVQRKSIRRMQADRLKPGRVGRAAHTAWGSQAVDVLHAQRGQYKYPGDDQSQAQQAQEMKKSPLWGLLW